MLRTLPRISRVLWILLGTAAAGGPAAAGVPVPFGHALVDPAGRGVGSFQTIRVASRWDSAGYRIEADFTGLDGGQGGSPAVYDSLNGAYLLVYTTGSMAGLPDSAGIVVQITAINASDPSARFTDRTLLICRNDSTNVPIHVETKIRDDKSRFTTGESLVVRSRWRIDGVRGFELTADYSRLVPDFRDFELRIRDRGVDTLGVANFDIAYRVPGQSRVVDDANGIPLVVIGRDALCSEVRYEGLAVDLRTASAPKHFRTRVRAPAGRGVRSFDTIDILTQWDSTTVRVEPDFSLLDGGTGGLPSVRDSSGGFHIIRYTLGSMEGLPDEPVTVALSGFNALADSVTDRSLQICRNLRTPPPIHLGTWIRDDRRRFRATDSLVIVSRWSHPAGLEITLEPLLDNLISDGAGLAASVSRRGVDTFLVSMKLPAKDRLVPDGRDIRIGVQARDTICNLVRYDSLLVEVDNTPPSAPPVYDPLPAETSQRIILVSGTAPGASRVAIVRENLLRFYTPVDTLTDRFETDLELTPGRNQVGGWGEDELGNKTVTATSQIVRYVVDRTTSYPTPFRPGDEITVGDGGGMSEAVIRIFNLEGEILAELRKEGSFLEARLIWNGRDSKGDLAQPGYYLMAIRRTAPDGETHEEIAPLLFRDDD